MNGVLGFASLLLASDLKTEGRRFESYRWSQSPNKINSLENPVSRRGLLYVLGGPQAPGQS